ncbi:uncharacterized protein LOC120344887 isoform X2 [Styela clava]
MIVWIAICLLQPSLSVQRRTWNASGSYEYYVSEADKLESYNESSEYCSENFGQLALVKSKNIQEFIQSLVTNGSGIPYGFFIGLRDKYGNNTYTWNDGSTLTYSNWLNSVTEPNNVNETCAMMGWTHTFKANLPWYDIKCQTRNGFVCQRYVGLYWSEWSGFSSCNCSGFQQRTRTCIDSGRDGPNNCSTADIVNINRQNCSIPSECPTTTTTSIPETTTELTSKLITTVTTKDSMPTSAISTSVTAKIPTTSTSETTPLLYIAIGGAGGAVILLAVVIVVVCLVRKRTTTSKSSSEKTQNDETPVEEAEYSTIVGTNVEALPEGEYATMGITNSPHNKQELPERNPYQSKLSVKITKKTNIEAGPTDEYATILNSTKMNAKVTESEYTVMQGSSKKGKGKLNTDKQLQVLDETTESTINTMSTQNISSENAELYAAVIPKAKRTTINKRQSTRGDTQKPVITKIEPVIGEINDPPVNDLYSSLIKQSPAGATGPSDQMYDVLNSQDGSVKALSKIAQPSIKNQHDSNYEETMLNSGNLPMGTASNQPEKQIDYVEEAMYSSLSDASTTTGVPTTSETAKKSLKAENSTLNDKENETEMYALLKTNPDANTTNEQMYDVLKL